MQLLVELRRDGDLVRRGVDRSHVVLPQRDHLLHDEGAERGEGQEGRLVGVGVVGDII